jgi:hypothetical protein
LKLPSVDLAIELIDIMTEHIVSIALLEGHTIAIIYLPELAGAWLALFTYDSILFGCIMSKTCTTRRTSRSPLIGIVFRDGEPRSI